jgi:hypothetical protein
MAETAITQAMDLTEYRNMGGGKSRRVSINPENTQSVSLTGSETKEVYFAYPSSSSAMINGQNSYLTFTIKVAGASVDDDFSMANGSPSSLIESLQLDIGSTTVELINDYNVFAGIVEDFQPLSRASNLGSILHGSKTPVYASTSTSTSTPSGASFDATPTLANLTITTTTTSTTVSSGYKKGRTIPGDDAVGIRVAIPLYSAVLGTMAQTHCPAVDGMRLRITFAQPNYGMVKEAGTSTSNVYQLSDISIEADYIDVLPQVYQQIVMESGGVLKCHGTGVGGFQTTMTAGTQNTLLIPARYSSLKNYFTVFRLSGAFDDEQNTIGARVQPNLKQYQYRIEGKSYPSTAVSALGGGGEVMAEVVKCFHALHSTQLDCVFDADDYKTESLSTTGAFVMGLDFEHEGGSSSIITGMDTLNSNTFLELQGDGSDLLASTVNTFALHDLIVEFNMMDGTVNVSK